MTELYFQNYLSEKAIPNSSKICADVTKLISKIYTLKIVVLWHLDLPKPYRSHEVLLCLNFLIVKDDSAERTQSPEMSFVHGSALEILRMPSVVKKKVMLTFGFSKLPQR